MERDTVEWVDLLTANNVPSGAILGLGEALAQPQVKHRKTLEDVEVEGIGTIPLFNLTAKFSETPGDITKPPPMLSAHTEEVLAGIGITAEEMADLKTRNII